MRTHLLTALLAVRACAGQEPPTNATAGGAPEAMIGAWDVTLSLSHPYPIGLDEPRVREICGTMGFVQNDHRAQSGFDSVPNLGVYDLDLTGLGLNWLNDASFPAALVTRFEPAQAKGVGARGDSVRIVLNPGSREQILLKGQRNVDGIDGVWVAQSARGTASGSFSLRPHDETRRTC